MCLSVSRTRSSVHSDLAEGSVSIPVLNRHIHMLRKRIRHFEERFEHEKHYKVRGEVVSRVVSWILLRNYWIEDFIFPPALTEPWERFLFRWTCLRVCACMPVLV